MKQMHLAALAGMMTVPSEWKTEAGYLDLVNHLYGDGPFDFAAMATCLFRRFGPPMMGYDGYKDLGVWRLSTSSPDIALILRPYPDSTPSMSIAIAVSGELMAEITAFDRAADKAWGADLEKALETNLKPSHLAQVKGHAGSGFSLQQFAMMAARGRFASLREDVREALRSEVEAFQEGKPLPGPPVRPADLRAVAADDPLSRIVRVVNEAIQDLRLGVQVRDWRVTLSGSGDIEEYSPDAAPSAGYGVGELFIHHPNEFHRLMGLVNKLGAGDAQLGVERAESLIQKELENSRNEEPPTVIF